MRQRSRLGPAAARRRGAPACDWCSAGSDGRARRPRRARWRRRWPSRRRRSRRSASGCGRTAWRPAAVPSASSARARPVWASTAARRPAEALGAEQVVVGHAVAREVVGRQVDAPGRGRPRRRPGSARRPAARCTRRRTTPWSSACRRAEHAEHHAADRVGRQPAVVDELGERGVAVDDLVAPVGLDEVVERLQRQVVTADGGAGPGEQRLDVVGRRPPPDRSRSAAQSSIARRSPSYSSPSQSTRRA